MDRETNRRRLVEARQRHFDIHQTSVFQGVVMFAVKPHVVALGRGKFIPGWVVTNDEQFVEWFRTESEAHRFIERKKEELTRDG